MKNHTIITISCSLLMKVFIFVALALSNPTFAVAGQWSEIESVYDGSGADARDYRYRGNTFSDVIGAPNSKGWYQGGTLHRVSIPDWNSASYQNQIATVAD